MKEVYHLIVYSMALLLFFCEFFQKRPEMHLKQLYLFNMFGKPDKTFLLALALLLCMRLSAQDFHQLLKSVPLDRQEGDSYGNAVAVKNDWAIIGACSGGFDEDGKNKLIEAGGVYIFKKDSNRHWQFHQKIVSPSRQRDGRFGYAVAISEERIVVGSFNQDPGQVYVYRLKNNVWELVQTLEVIDKTYQPKFGWSLALRDRQLIVGSLYSLDTADETAANGLAFIYDYSASEDFFQYGATLRLPKGDGGDLFSRSVEIEGNIAIVSDDWNSSVNKKGEMIERGGAVYVYEKTNLEQWIYTQTLTPEDLERDDVMGLSIAINNGTIFAGCHHANYNVNGKMVCDNTGAVYVFRKNKSGSWVQNQKIHAPIVSLGDNFGYSIAVDKDLLLVGTWTRNVVYVYKVDETGRFNFKQKIEALDKAGGRTFGSSVAISGNELMAGAYDEKRDQFGQNEKVAAGAAYFFRRYNPVFASGKVYFDDNKNCQYDSLEAGLLYPVFTQFQATIPDSSGKYILPLEDSIDYTIRSAMTGKNKVLLEDYCPAFYQIKTNGRDSAGLDIGIRVKKDCPYVVVEGGATRRRPCFKSSTIVKVKNDGFSASEPVKLYILQPEYIHTLSSNFKYLTGSDVNLLKFDLGILKPNEERIIRIDDSVSCREDLIGLQLCTQMWITPLNTCARSIDSNWDESRSAIISVSGQTRSGQVAMIVKNKGFREMLSAREYRVFKDNVLIDYGRFKLGGEDSLVLEYVRGNGTYRIEAEQQDRYPGFPYAAFEFYSGSLPLDHVRLTSLNQLPVIDFTGEVSRFCLPVVSSFDPNNKAVSPSGVTEEHILPPSVPLSYVVNFQNTGTDTAYDVLVIDTLAEFLDINTFEAGVSSSAYKLIITRDEQFILKFFFKNINLPDSHVNEPESHGFVSFKIKPYGHLDNKTFIRNFADIYFDFNEAIRTDTAGIMIDSDYFKYEGFRNRNDAAGLSASIYPNPSENKFVFMFKDQRPSGIKLFDVTGKMLLEQSVKSEIESLYLVELQDGIYYAKVIWGNDQRVYKLLKISSN